MANRAIFLNDILLTHLNESGAEWGLEVTPRGLMGMTFARD